MEAYIVVYAAKDELAFGTAGLPQSNLRNFIQKGLENKAVWVFGTRVMIKYGIR